MITLCPTTFEIASKMKNFSKWVRQKMLEEHVQVQEETVYGYRCPACWKSFYSREEKDDMYCMNKDCGYTKKLEAFE